MQPESHAGFILFYELSSHDAKARLRALQRQLKLYASVRETTLLESLDQAGLFLLVVEADRRLELEANGARVWMFQKAGSSKT
jgi:hypothetical protein